MTVTFFGLAFLPIVGYVLLLRREWLLPLMVVAAALHAPAVLVVGDPTSGSAMGISPWLIASSAVSVHLAALVWRNQRVSFGATWNVRSIFAGWTVLCAYAVISAFSLPLLFEGMPTYNQEIVQSISHGPEPLVWRFVNAAHAINFSIIWILFLYVLQIQEQKRLPSSIVQGFLAALVLSAVLSLLQRFLIESGVPTPTFVAESLNPSYAHSVGYVYYREIARVGWPFSEPSYAGVWFAALLSAGLGLHLFSDRVKLGAIVTCIAIAGVLNSLSGSGIGAAILIGATIYSAALAKLLRKPDSERKAYALRLAIFPALSVVALVTGLLTTKDATVHYEGFGTQTLWQAGSEFIATRLNDHQRPGNTRSESNRTAVGIVINTYGIGVGLGSNRASSFVLNMASNLGVPATLLFFALVLSQIRLLARSTFGPASQLLAFGTSGALLGVVLAIPDLAWPACWIWIIAGFALLQIQSTPQHTVKSA